jgi:hypothetical protein
MKRLPPLSDPKFWDRWRELYDSFSHEENIEIGNALEAAYPHQVSFNAELFEKFFSTQPPGVRVLEIGGWKGELAKHLLERNPNIAHWHNIDMCRAAVLKTVPMGELAPRYTSEFPGSFDWFKQPREFIYDIAISAHTIEHLSDSHLKDLIGFLSGIPVIVFEAPISQETGVSWAGYPGTHILKMGWAEIESLMAMRGYRATQLSPWAYSYALTPKTTP